MNTKSLRALAFALLLGGAGVFAATVATTQTAEAAAVRPAVGNPLKQAIELAKNGSGAAALAKVREAESVGSLTGDEQRLISQTREFVSVKTGAGGTSTAIGCKAKFANDYSAGRYSLVVGEDQDCLRKFGAYDYSSQVVVGQAYYLSGQYATAIRVLRPLANSEQVLSLVMSAAFKNGDSETVNWAAEQLVVKYNKPQYWQNLLSGAERTRGLKDSQLIDVYRLRYLTGGMRNDRDYMLLGQLAIQFGSPGEALAVIQKGFDVKALSDIRAQRLLALAKSENAKGLSTLAARTRQAQAAPRGDNLLKIGEEDYGYGKYQDSVNATSAAIKKGVTDRDTAQIRLAMGYVALKDSGSALKALGGISKTATPGVRLLANLWGMYARTH